VFHVEHRPGLYNEGKRFCSLELAASAPIQAEQDTAVSVCLSNRPRPVHPRLPPFREERERMGHPVFNV